MDVAIYNTHFGGEIDATNVTDYHGCYIDCNGSCRLLGPTTENIAWHKAGGSKSGSTAFSTLQENAVTTVLWQRAAEKG